MLPSAEAIPARGPWLWRMTLAWTLLGPSVVLLVQLETLLVLADAFDAFPLRAGVSRWAVSVAVAALLLVCAAQIASFLWGLACARRGRLLDRRLAFESRLAVTVVNSSGSTDPGRPSEEWIAHEVILAEADKGGGSPQSIPDRTPVASRVRAEARRLEQDAPEVRRLLDRFGMEPTWAYQVLSDLGQPDATDITRRVKLGDARLVGLRTALLLRPKNLQ